MSVPETHRKRGRPRKNDIDDPPEEEEESIGISELAQGLKQEAMKVSLLTGKSIDEVMRDALSTSLSILTYKDFSGQHFVQCINMVRNVISTVRELGQISAELGTAMYRTSIFEQIRALKEAQKEALDLGILSDIVAKHIRERFPEIEQKIKESITEAEKIKTDHGPSQKGIIDMIVSRTLGGIIDELKSDIVAELRRRGLTDVAAKTLADMAQYTFIEYARKGSEIR